MPHQNFDDQPVPTWLKIDSMHGNFNRSNLFNGSVYYPGCQFDLGPIREFCGWARSFVYADYRVRKEDVISMLADRDDIKILFSKDIEQSKLHPMSVPYLQPTLYDFLHNENDRRLSHYESFKELKISHNAQIKEITTRYPFFATWIIFEIKKGFSDKPKRCSLLYICGEGVALYSSIYNANEMRPAAIVLTPVDIGFGGNWTYFERNGGIFEKTVMANSAGIPDYLITRGDYWPSEVEDETREFKNYWNNYVDNVSRSSPRHNLNIWQNSEIPKDSYLGYD